jgi:hypothetical protein
MAKWSLNAWFSVCNICLISTLLVAMRMMRHILLALAACLPAASPAQAPLRLSELLFQPRSGEAEYVELYNGGNETVNLSDYLIIRWIGDSLGKQYPLPQHAVAPHDYVVLTKDAASVTANYTVRYASKLIECSLPTYPNDGGSVVLATADGTVVEKFDYSPSMHSRLLRNKAGVALERRDMGRPCNEPGNWFSASSVAGYGTPGYDNSQSTEWLVEETAFELSSTLLSPDGDGYQDELVVSYRLEGDDLYGDCVLFDARGNRVCRLLNNALLGTHGELCWSGRDDNGAALPTGRYVLFLDLHNLQGTQQVIKRTLTLVR